jgi:hypothetical protein
MRRFRSARKNLRRLSTGKILVGDDSPLVSKSAKWAMSIHHMMVFYKQFELLSPSNIGELKLEFLLNIYLCLL